MTPFSLQGKSVSHSCEVGRWTIARFTLSDIPSLEAEYSVVVGDVEVSGLPGLSVVVWNHYFRG